MDLAVIAARTTKAVRPRQRGGILADPAGQARYWFDLAEAGGAAARAAGREAQQEVLGRATD